MIDSEKLAELRTIFEKFIATDSIAMSTQIGEIWEKYPGDKPNYFRDALDAFNTLEALWKENAELKEKLCVCWTGKAHFEKLEAVVRLCSQSDIPTQYPVIGEALAALKEPTK